MRQKEARDLHCEIIDYDLGQKLSLSGRENKSFKGAVSADSAHAANQRLRRKFSMEKRQKLKPKTLIMENIEKKMKKKKKNMNGTQPLGWGVLVYLLVISDSSRLPSGTSWP